MIEVNYLQTFDRTKYYVQHFQIDKIYFPHNSRLRQPFTLAGPFFLMIALRIIRPKNVRLLGANDYIRVIWCQNFKRW